MNGDRLDEFESPDDLRRVRALKVEIRELKNALESERKRNTELLSSTSWKLTAPLRTLVEWLKGTRVHEAVHADLEPPSPLASVPPVLRKSTGAGLLGSNETFAIVDASDAMAPLLDARATCNTPGEGEGETKPRIAAIVSNELQYELAFDASVAVLVEDGWFEQLRPGRFDYVLLETIWCLDGGQWRYSMIAGAGHGDGLEKLLAHCRSIALPVLLWFREDLSNYDRFSWLVEKVDRTYAIDEAVLDRLRSDFPAAAISLLPPAVQPKLHNPIRSRALQEASAEFSGQILLDGWWDIVNDKALTEQLLGACGERLRVCESEWEFSGARLLDSAGLLGNTIGCVSLRDKAALARLFPFELFLAASMRLPWRTRQAMLRTAACGCLPLQVAGSGNPMEWPMATGTVAELQRFAFEIAGKPLQRMRLEQEFARRVVRHECMADRLDQIASDLSLDVGRLPREPKVAAILVTMRPQLAAACIDRYRREQYREKELIIVLHGDSTEASIRALAERDESIRVMSMGREHNLGACLNFAIDSTDAPYWSKFDDDDYYGPSYLQDVMSARRWFDFDIAGKPPMFSYLQRDDALYWDPAWAEQANVLHSTEEPHRVLVAGATLTGRREVLDGVPFSSHRRGGADSDFLRRSLRAGHDVLGLDGFGFVRFRSDRDGFHTHQVSDAEVRARSVHIGSQAQLSELAFL